MCPHWSPHCFLDWTYSSPTVLMKPYGPHSLPLSGSLSPWVTVARLQPRPVGPCKLRPVERLAVCLGHCTPSSPLPPTLALSLQHPHSPTRSHKRVRTTLGPLFGPQNAPHPPGFFFSPEKAPAELSHGRRGREEKRGGLRGPAVANVMSVWTLIKGKTWFL